MIYRIYKESIWLKEKDIMDIIQNFRFYAKWEHKNKHNIVCVDEHRLSPMMIRHLNKKIQYDPLFRSIIDNALSNIELQPNEITKFKDILSQKIEDN